MQYMKVDISGVVTLPHATNHIYKKSTTQDGLTKSLRNWCKIQSNLNSKVCRNTRRN